MTTTAASLDSIRFLQGPVMATSDEAGSKFTIGISAVLDQDQKQFCHITCSFVEPDQTILVNKTIADHWKPFREEDPVNTYRFKRAFRETMTENTDLYTVLKESPELQEIFIEGYFQSNAAAFKEHYQMKMTRKKLKLKFEV